jgi:TatA/E family protein of Tat protein translocase
MLTNTGKEIQSEHRFPGFSRLTSIRGKAIFSMPKETWLFKKRRKNNNMFGSIGFPELLAIMAIALLVFGPKKLPEVGRSLGRALREFRKTSNEIKGKIEEEIQASELKDLHEEIKKDIDGKGEGY